MSLSTDDSPTAAFVLSLIGGIIVLLSGLFIMVVGALATFFLGGIGATFGLFGVLWGILMIVGAIILRSMPDKHVTGGVIVLVASLLSWFGTFGRLFIGFILGLIGGILGIIWKPSSYAANFPSSARALTRFCPNCGRQISPDIRYCPHCGKELP